MVTVAKLRSQFLSSKKPSTSQASSSALSQAHSELTSTGKVSPATVNQITLARSSETGKTLVPAISPLSPQKTAMLEQAEEPLSPQQFRERVASDIINTTGNITPLQIQEFATSQQIPMSQAEQFLRVQFPDRFEAVPVENVRVPLPVDSVQDSLHEAITNMPLAHTAPAPAPAPQVLLPEALPATSIREPLFGEDLLPLLSPINSDGSINWLAILIYAGIALLLLGVFA